MLQIAPLLTREKHASTFIATQVLLKSQNKARPSLNSAGHPPQLCPATVITNAFPLDIHTAAP